MLHHASGIMPEFDERREIARLLRHLTPARRIEWLKWCCKQVSAPSVETKVLASDGSVNAVWWDAVSLFYGSHLTMRTAGARLVDMVNGRA